VRSIDIYYEKSLIAILFILVLFISGCEDPLFSKKVVIGEDRYDSTVSKSRTSLIELTGNYYDYGVDEDEDGLYDYLGIEVEVQVNIAGDYNAEGKLKTENGRFIGSSSSESGYLTEGIHNLTLLYDGSEIIHADENGPYELFLIFLKDDDGNILETGFSEHFTESYSVNMFEVAIARLTGNYYDYVIDGDGDGFYDYLTIDVEVQVNEGGEYRMNGKLITENYTYIYDAVEKSPYLTEGVHNLTILFEGNDIYLTKEDGPYKVLEISLLVQGDNSQVYDEIGSGRDVLDTNNYDHSRFEHEISGEPIEIMEMPQKAPKPSFIKSLTNFFKSLFF
jgi:hypothetical protein